MSAGDLRESDGLLGVFESLQKIREGSLDPAAFWASYVEALRLASGAEAALAGVRPAKEGSPWQPLAFSPQSLRTGGYAAGLFARLEAADQALGAERAGVLAADQPPASALRIRSGSEDQKCLALFSYREEARARVAEALELLKRLDDVPANFQAVRSAQEAVARQGQFADLVDLMSVVGSREKFLPAAIALVNELAARHRCERVTLGWLDDGYARLQAMSHVDGFDRKMEVVQALELAMEESLDQDADVVLPAARDEKVISRDHAALRRAAGVQALASLPLRGEPGPLGVCTFERSGAAFTPAELRLMRLALDQAARRLEGLKRRERWFGARWAEVARERLTGTEWYTHTWAKAGAVAGFVVLAFLCFVPVTYRLESPVSLKTDDVTFLTAPFDGHIERVAARVGDEVEEGGELLRLDQNDLMLEQAGLVAEKSGHAREAEKARAANALADMRISESRYDQAAARLDLVRHRLEQSVLRAPTAGVVVEGDLLERVGSPVKQGDVLFRIGRTDRLYAELEVPESEIQHVKAGQSGEVSLAGRPTDEFRFEVVRVEPAAVAKEEGNVYVVRAQFGSQGPAWWRPGMTGVAKVNAGRKTLLWIFTHRTMDFLRLKLWW